jgi:EAL domain-containing protein (putative c-di-GMP-specific phosphodiesterase class I)
MTACAPNVSSESSVADIIRAGGIKSRFQPIVALKSQSILGVEALSWGDDGRAPISPLELFARARVEGSVLELDRECRRVALAEFARSFSGAKALLFLNIESSIMDMGSVGSGYLMAQCARAGISPSQVVLEIVETNVRDESLLVDFVRTHRRHGFTIAIDDMGEGHSNLNRIALIRPDIIKADRALARDLARDYMKQRIVSSLVGLSRNIGALFLLEGIETEDDALQAFRLGTDLYQGYFFARPGETSREAIMALERRLASVASSARDAAIRALERRTRVIERCLAEMEPVVRDLRCCRDDGLDAALVGYRGRIDRCECLFVLDERGIQVSDTALQADYPPVSRFSAIFGPAARGCDHSAKDYFYFAANANRRFVSDPYISFSSGTPCFTITIPFVLRKGRSQRYLCADFSDSR